MQFVKASERLPEHISDNLHIRNIKTKGRIEPGYFRNYAGKEYGWELEKFEWLDENPSPPASAEEEAARLYPDEATGIQLMTTTNEIAAYERSAHITCAGMYTGEIERLRAENEALIEEIQNWKDELRDQAREHRNNR